MFLVLAVSSPAFATEIVWDGFYRGRGLIYDSLSLSRSNAYAEGTSNSIDHRLLLRPTWIVSEHARLNAQVDLLPFTLWGDEPAVATNLETGEPEATATTDGVVTTAAGLVAVRAWADVSARFGDNASGRFAAGRMPMEWGAGILWNPGNQPDSEWGDTADRLQFSGTVGQVWLLAAWDQQYEGFLGSPDDMQSFSLALGYRNETNGAGLLNNYRYQPSAGWQAYTGDLWAFARLGPLDLELEAVGVFGGGDLDTGVDDAGVMAFGAMIEGDLRLERVGFALQAGLATGDSDPTDEKLRTFSFDPDHNVALMLFEQPLPTLATSVENETNAGRTTEAARTGDGISNALYLRPTVRYTLRPDLVASLDWTAAMVAKGPDSERGSRGYGNELDLSVRYDPIPHVWVKGTVGVFFPGAYYSDWEHPDLGGGFDATAVGGSLVGTVEF